MGATFPLVGINLAGCCRFFARGHTGRDLFDVVECQVEVLEVLHVVQVPYLADDVVLEVQNLEPAAVGPERLVDRLQLLLLKGVATSTGSHSQYCGAFRMNGLTLYRSSLKGSDLGRVETSVRRGNTWKQMQELQYSR